MNKQEARKRFLKRARSLKGTKIMKEKLYNEEEIMSKKKLHKFREVKHNDHSNSFSKENK
jgi:hypothetical protein